jgi:drug/metabolite transporter (DMT)-like permease
MHSRFFPYVESIFVAMIWAASPPLIKILLEDLSPSEITGIRYVGAFLLFIPLLLTFSRGILRKLTTKDWILLTIVGLTSFSIGDLMTSKGLENINATTSAFLLNGIPILTFLLGAVFLNEKPASLQWLGLVVALAGGVVFFGLSIDLSDFYSIVLTLVGVLAYTASGLVGRAIARKKVVDPITLSALPIGIGGFIILSISPPQAFPPRATWGIILWLIVMATILSLLLWNHARRTLKAFEMSITVNLIPIGTALISPWLIGETIPGRAWAGMLVTLMGVLLVGLTGRHSPDWVTDESFREGNLFQSQE